MQPQFQLKEFSLEELKQFNLDLQAFLDNHSAHLIAHPYISDDGLTKGRIMAFKKVELVPKEDGTLEPKKEENGENINDKQEQSPEGN